MLVIREAQKHKPLEPSFCIVHRLAVKLVLMHLRRKSPPSSRLKRPRIRKMKRFARQSSKSLPVSSGVATALLIVFAATIGLLNFSGALGEEIGWRGFVVPAFYQLTRGNFTATALMSGIVWAVWHAPIIFLSSYNNPGVSRLYSFSWFVLLILASATIDAWYRLRSGSLWTGVILRVTRDGLSTLSTSLAPYCQSSCCSSQSISGQSVVNWPPSRQTREKCTNYARWC
jgi:hypothetical protein